MQNQPQSSARVVFFYLLMVAMLYSSVISTITLLFQYINVAFPDPLEGYWTRNQIFSSFNMASASLLIAFPVFLFISYKINKEISVNKEQSKLRIRHWLLYLTLFIAAITIIIDLIQLIFNFYSGDLTTRFALKITVVLLIALAVFGYYLWDLNRKNGNSKIPKYTAISSTILVLIILISGFFIVGTPGYQRLAKIDDEKINHLQTIQNELVYYWQNKDELPDQLSALEDPLRNFTVPRDPISGKMYTYNKKGTLTFELCADFATEYRINGSDKFEENNNQKRFTEDSYHLGFNNEYWQHPKGEKCFERTIDPIFYKNEKNR